MTRIGINCLSVVPGELGGAETYLVNLVYYLTRIDSMNEYYLFVTPENRYLFQQPRSRNFHLVNCSVSNSIRPMRIAWEQFILPVKVSQLDLDLLHSPGNTSPIMLGIPSVLSIQSLHVFKYPEMFSPYKRFYLQLLTRLSIQSAKRIIAVSSDTKTDIISLFSINNSVIDVIYEGVGTEFVPNPDPKDEEILAKYHLHGPFILCPSTLYPYKNLGRLLQAFARFKKGAVSLAKLVVVGGDWQGESKAMKNQAKELNIEGDYIYLGMLPHKEMPALYRGATLVVYPSLAETFGLPLLESMACGTPVACSDRTSLPEVGGEAVRYFDPIDIRAMAIAIHELFVDQSLRQRLMNRGLERVEKFNWVRTAEKTIQTYKSVL